MASKGIPSVSVAEAQQKMHQKPFFGKDHTQSLFLSVPGTKRRVKVQDCNGYFIIKASRPTDLIHAKALDSWGESKSLKRLDLNLHMVTPIYGPVHEPTKAEWQELFSHLIKAAPLLRECEVLNIDLPNRPNRMVHALLEAFPQFLVQSLSKIPSLKLIRFWRGRMTLDKLKNFHAALKKGCSSLERGETYDGKPCTVFRNGSREAHFVMNQAIVVWPVVVGSNQDCMLPTDIQRIGLIHEIQPEVVNRDWSAGSNKTPNPELCEELYERACSFGKVKAHRGRIVVLGHSGAGKTSLVRCLLGEEFVTDHVQTNLIDIYKVQRSQGKWSHDTSTDSEIVDTSNLLGQAMRNEGRESIALDVSHDPLVGITHNTDPQTKPAFKKLWKESDLDARANSGKAVDIGTTQPIVTGRNIKDVTRFPGHDTVIKEYKENKRKSNHSVHVWDMGGQHVFYATHQIFLNKGSIYLIVLDMSIGLDEEIPNERTDEHGNMVKDFYHPTTPREYFNFFARTINSRVFGKIGQKPEPEIHLMVIGTKCDLISDGERKLRKQEIEKHIAATVKNHHIRYSVGAVYTFSSKVCGVELLTEIREVLSEILKRKPFHVQFPVRWMFLRDELKKKECMRWTDVKAKAEAIGIKQVDELTAALEYFHQLGEILFFNKELKDWVVGQPSWVVDEIKKVLTIREYQEMKDGEKSRWLWSTLNEEGVLHEDITDDCWGSKKEELITLMEMFGLIYSWKKDKHDHDRRRFLVPCFLPKVDTTGTFGNCFSPSPIYVEITDPFFPFGFTSAVLATLAMRNEWELNDEKLYSNQATFMISPDSPSIHIQITEIEKEKMCILKISSKLGRRPKDRKETLKVYRSLHDAQKQMADAVKDCLTERNIESEFRYSIDCKCKMHRVHIYKNGQLEEEVSCTKGGPDFTTTHLEAWFLQEPSPSLPDGSVLGIKQMDEDAYRHLLTEATPQLKEKMRMDSNFMVLLLEEHAIDDQMRRSLKSLTLHDDKVMALIDHVKKDVESRMNPLIKALKASDQEHVVSVITEGVPVDSEGMVVISQSYGALKAPSEGRAAVNIGGDVHIHGSVGALAMGGVIHGPTTQNISAGLLSSPPAT